MIHELRFERVKRWGMDGLEPSGTAERGLGRVHTNQKERERERFPYSHYSLFPTCTATYRTNYRFRDRLRPRSRKSPEIPE